MEWQIPKDGSLRPFLVLFILIVQNAIASIPSVPTVRVMVEREKGIRVEGFDVVISDATADRTILRNSSKAALPMKCSLGSGIQIYSKANHGNKPEVLKVKGPIKVESLGGFLRIDGKQFRDALYVYSFNGDCIVVNHLDIEKYVAGLLHSEMNANWNIETLKAQAVAARTYAIFQMREASTAKFKSSKPPFDLDSSVKDQVYEGANQERYKAISAVNETKGMILTYENEPIKAFYHSTCGGRTEKAEKVWGKKIPYISSVTCGFCNSSPRYKWSYEISTAQLSEKLRKLKLIQGEIKSFGELKKNSLGRIDQVTVFTDSGEYKISGVKLRDTMGSTNIMSTDFKIASSSGVVVFAGNGSGHGVGMCQWGAKSMGEKGKSYSEILSHYYPKAKLTKLF